jgi:GTP 3',8-cyclase
MKAHGLLRSRDRLLTRSLELNVTTHCNLKCYGCGRGSPAFEEEFAQIDQLRQDVKALARVLHTQEFKLAGGEPLQHPEVVPIARMVAESGIADRITLITNGVLLDQTPDILWDTIDHMWVSVYPGVERGMDEDAILARGEAHGVTIRYKVTDSFDRRMLNARNTDPNLVGTIFRTCYQTRGCHSLFNGRYFKCASGPLIPRWLDKVGCDKPDFRSDGVSVRDNPDLKAALTAYLSSETPLEACHYCLGGMGMTEPHRQLNREGVRDWLGEDHSDVRTLIDTERLDAEERSPLLARVSSGILNVLGR